MMRGPNSTGSTHRSNLGELLEAEFDYFIPIRNTKAKAKTPSPNDRYDHGTDEGLCLPSNLHLGLFAGAVKRIYPRVAEKEGIVYKTKNYVPVNPDPAIGVALSTATLNKQKVSTLVITLKNFTVLYINLPDGTWVELIEKGKRNWSTQKQRKWKQSVTQLLAQDKSASLARLQEELVDELGRKLSIEPFEEDFIKHPQGHHEEIDGNQDECHEKQDTTNLESNADMQDQLKPRNDSPRPTKKKSRTRGTGPQSDERILHPDTEGCNATILALDVPVAEQEAVDQTLDVILRRIHRPNLG